MEQETEGEAMEEEQVSAHLDEDLIVTEILTRLPAKSVLRFRAVCKGWCRATAGTEFLAAHARRRPLEVLIYTRINFAAPANRNAVDLDLDALSVAVSSSGAPQRRRLARFPNREPPEYRGEPYCLLLGSCGGLLLLRRQGHQYLVCNPATRQWTELPRLRSHGHQHLSVYHTHQQSGFYFHESSGEYRLLCHITLNTLGVAAPYYYVFSAGANEPRRLNVQATPMHQTIIADDKPTFNHINSLMTPAVLGGHLHWLQHMEAGLTDQMVAFDTVAETFRLMPPPPVTCKEHANMFVADGSLAASELRDQSVDIWVLEGYGGEERWERRHRVEVPWRAQTPNVVAGGDEGDVVLGTQYGMVVYNARSRTARWVAGMEAKDGGILLLSRSVLRESLVRHGFFEARPHPGLPFFSLF